MWFSFHFAGLSLLGYSQTHLPLIHVKPCFTGDVLNICTRARAKILVWQWKRRCKHTLKPKNKDKILLACVFMLCIKSMSYYTTLSLCTHWIYSVMQELIAHLARAANNGRSTDNVRPDCGLDRSNSALAGHFDRSFLDTNTLFSIQLSLNAL